jgi:dihydrolipoamide dehydrogenase
MGRKPNVDDSGLENTGLKLDKRGVPVFDPRTMRAGNSRIFLGGDVDGDRAVQHEAADDGRIAGMNSVKRKIERFPRKTRLAITFCEPNLAVVGARFSELERKSTVIGEVSFANQGRSKILGENHGLLRVYAHKKSGKLIGAELAAPRGEHLAHLLAWSVMQKMTAKQFLQQPFYHPVVEEALRTAVRKLI